MSKFTAWTEELGTVSVVHLQGILDTSTALSLAQTIESLLVKEQSKIVMEVRQVWEIDQVGLQVILSGQSQAQEKEGDLRLAQPSPMFLDLLEIPELKKRLQCFPTVQEAIDSYPKKKKKKPRKIRLPISLKKEIGLGDLIKGLTSAMGIKPCHGCEQRAEKLNNMVTLSGKESAPKVVELPDR